MITIGKFGIEDRKNQRTETVRDNVVHDHNLTILDDEMRGEWLFRKRNE